MRSRLFLAMTVAGLILFILASAAPAEHLLHLKLDTSMPEAGQVLDASPEKIVLEFSQRPELAVSKIELKGADAAAQLSDVARSEDDDTILWAAVEEPLVDGIYTVSWVTGAPDGHPVRGEFTFSVRANR